MENKELTFNDLPQVVAQLRDEVMGMRTLLIKQQEENRHKPMTVEEAADYTRIPLGTLYMKLGDGTIPATKPGKRYVLYQDELDKWLEANRKNPIQMSEILSVSQRTIERDLSALQKFGVLKREGKDNDGKWVIISVSH